MKITILALFSAITCACVNAPKFTSNAPTNGVDDQPPTNFEWTWQDNGHHRAATTPLPSETSAQEEQKYQDSISRISSQIQDERLQLLMTEEIHGKNSKQYHTLLWKFCEIDMLLDLRGNHHGKDFCKGK